MERAPLPPHERTWRHPSELGPTAPTNDHTSAGQHGVGVWLATGSLAIIAVAALVVAITPRNTSGPVALTSTTLPAAAQTVRSAVSTVTTNEVQAGVVALANSVRTARIDEFTAIPSAIAAIPGGVAIEGVALTEVAADVIASNDVMLPDLTDQVQVISHEFIYAVRWRDVAQLVDIDDAVVVTDDGAVIAVIADGRLVVASDSYNGASDGYSNEGVRAPISLSVQTDSADRLSLDD